MRGGIDAERGGSRMAVQRGLGGGADKAGPGTGIPGNGAGRREAGPPIKVTRVSSFSTSALLLISSKHLRARLPVDSNHDLHPEISAL